MASGIVKIINLEPTPRDITLLDGRDIRLQPFSFSGTEHISDPIPKKLIPDGLK